VLLRRIETRTTNDYGKKAADRELILGQIAEVEPSLSATCTHETDAAQSVGHVVAELARIGADRER
jgi:hypothetical protein